MKWLITLALLLSLASADAADLRRRLLRSAVASSDTRTNALTPTFSPNGGLTYQGHETNVTITSAGPTPVNIYWTTNGATPTTNLTAWVSPATVTNMVAGTLKALAYTNDAFTAPSSVASATFTNAPSDANYTLVSSGINNAGSVTLNTVGANLIVASLGTFSTGAATFSDDQGNTFTLLTRYGSGNLVTNRLAYCISPNTAASHTFTLSQTIPLLWVGAFSRSSGTPAFNEENGTGSDSYLTIQPGSVNSSGTAILFVTGITLYRPGDPNQTIDSSFTKDGQVNNSSINLAVAYKLTGTTENPTWTSALDFASGGTGIAVFK